MRGFRLGSVFGFEIRIDFSWFIIFFLILWTFTFGVFPATAPGLDTGVYLAMGVTGTLLFFASLLAHEISHSLVARPRDELTVVSPREPMSRVLERIGGQDAGRIVVASGDRVEGVITRSDLARWIERAEMLDGS